MESSKMENNSLQLKETEQRSSNMQKVITKRMKILF
jgi:hypothetical protein